MKVKVYFIDTNTVSYYHLSRNNAHNVTCEIIYDLGVTKRNEVTYSEIYNFLALQNLGSSLTTGSLTIQIIGDKQY